MPDGDRESVVMPKRKDLDVSKRHVDGTKNWRIPRREVIPEAFEEYGNVSDDDGNLKFVRRRLEFAFDNLASEGGTMRKLKRQKEHPDDLEYKETKLDDESKEIVRRKKPLVWVDAEGEGGTTRRVKRGLKETECDYDGTGRMTVVKTPKQFEMREMDVDSVARMVRVEAVSERMWLYT